METDMAVEVDFERIIREEAKSIAEGMQYAISQLALRTISARDFVMDIAQAIAASPLAERDDFDRNYRGTFPFEWYTYSHDGGHVDYKLKRDESISDIAPVIKWMTQHGWDYVAKPEPDNLRVVYHLKRGESCGNFVVKIDESKTCKLIEDGEEVVPSRTIKKYRIECEPSVEQVESVEVRQLSAPDGDEEQSRPGFSD